MICGIIQSSFIPWRGYFDIINDCNFFVFHDDIQYTKQDFRNRNRIKTRSGLKWITVPVGKIPTDTRIDQVVIANSDWAKKHLRLIRENYRRAPYFKEYFPLLEFCFRQPWKKLSTLNIALTLEIAKILKIQTTFVRSSELKVSGKKTDRIIDICRQLGATHYISGPAARVYIEEERLENLNIKLSYKEYIYPPYPQLHGEFSPQASIIDLLLNHGPHSSRYIWGDIAQSYRAALNRNVRQKTDWNELPAPALAVG